MVTGSIDEFFTYEPGKFCIIQDWLEKKRAWMPGRDGRVGNTSLFRYNLTEHAKVYTEFASDQRKALDSFRIEQQYAAMCCEIVRRSVLKLGCKALNAVAGPCFR